MYDCHICPNHVDGADVVVMCHIDHHCDDCERPRYRMNMFPEATCDGVATSCNKLGCERPAGHCMGSHCEHCGVYYVGSHTDAASWCSVGNQRVGYACSHCWPNNSSDKHCLATCKVVTPRQMHAYKREVDRNYPEETCVIRSSLQTPLGRCLCGRVCSN
jgi:hypothetical protein